MACKAEHCEEGGEARGLHVVPGAAPEEHNYPRAGAAGVPAAEVPAVVVQGDGAEVHSDIAEGEQQEQGRGVPGEVPGEAGAFPGALFVRARAAVSAARERDRRGAVPGEGGSVRQVHARDGEQREAEVFPAIH